MFPLPAHEPIRIVFEPWDLQPAEWPMFILFSLFKGCIVNKAQVSPVVVWRVTPY